MRLEFPKTGTALKCENCDTVVETLLVAANPDGEVKGFKCPNCLHLYKICSCPD